jgi:Dolichyl-phosphate-mannose-protein mannosyltransferase
MLTIPLALSAFTHLWNPIGFPAVHNDEGWYMLRAMHVLAGLGPLENPFFNDHPYFGQLFLAAMLGTIGYPGSLHPSSSAQDIEHSIEMLYTVPRILMGLLAVVDTFLIYKITEYRYNNKTAAFIAAILFAVMPLSWITRRILLDSILLPFLLSSILLAVYPYRAPNLTENKKKNNNILSKIRKGIISSNTRNISIVLLSGIFLGTAIFTKIPAFTMIPLVGFLIFTNTNRNSSISLLHHRHLHFNKEGNNNTNPANASANTAKNTKSNSPKSKTNIRIQNNLKMLGLWFIPVILIPAIWPAYAISLGQFDDWQRGVTAQTQRQDVPLSVNIKLLFQIEPILMFLGFAGSVFAAIVKKDFVLLFWVIPFLIFLYLIGHTAYFYLLPILPALCIAGAKLIFDLSEKISTSYIRKILPFGSIAGIGLFGLISTSMIITTNVASSQFQAAAFVGGYLQSKGYINSNKITLVSSPVYSWVFRYLFEEDKYVYPDYRFVLFSPIHNGKAVLISDPHFISNKGSDTRLERLYSNTESIVLFKNAIDNANRNKYPFTSLLVNNAGSKVEIRVEG